MNFEILSAFFLTSVGLTVAPGPDILFVLMQSISNGKGSGIAVAAGLVSGILIHTTAVAFGISQLLITSELLFLSIKIFGACYLVYIAYQVAIATPDETVNYTQIKPKSSYLKLYKQGFIMNITNPKVTLFFLALFPAFLSTKTDTILAESYLLGFIFLVQAFLIFTLVAVLADRYTTFLRTNTRFLFFLKWFQISVYLGLAIFLFV